MPKVTVDFAAVATGIGRVGYGRYLVARRNGHLNGMANLRYLWEPGLIAGQWGHFSGGGATTAGATLTAKGIDFLADDGGLSATLGVVTVKLHGDSIKALLLERVEKSAADTSVKKELIEKIKPLSESAAAISLLESHPAKRPSPGAPLL